VRLRSARNKPRRFAHSLVISIEPNISDNSPQQLADLLLEQWNRNRHLPPALRLSRVRDMDLWFLGLGAASAVAVVIVTAVSAVVIGAIFDPVIRIEDDE
jgi:hypothetical protein